MGVPYERYETLAEPLTVYYPTGEEARARWVFQTIEKAGACLSELLARPMPDIELLLVSAEDWALAPRDEDDASPARELLPYWTEAVTPPCIVVPQQIDPVFGAMSQQRFAQMLYHELALAFLEDDQRPWPDDYPLWADEWQLQYAALWLAQTINGVEGVVNKDLHEEYGDIFEPEPDGKTPVTIRGFDWDEDTSAEDYFCYSLLLEQFAADLLAHYDAQVLPRFLAAYRTGRETLLSDEVALMLGDALGPGGIEWLEGLVYF